jgi:4-carboxymuconolactone decarboxylase
MALLKRLLQRTSALGQQQQGASSSIGSTGSSVTSTTNHSTDSSDLTNSCHPNLFLFFSSFSPSWMGLFRYAILGVLVLVGLWRCWAESFHQPQSNNNISKHGRAFERQRRTKTTLATPSAAPTPAAAASAASTEEKEVDPHRPHVYTAAHLTARYTGPPTDEMTVAQREIRDAILRSRPTTGLAGPFGPWLAVPVIARPAQELGKAVRYGTSLSFAESELVILLTAAKTRSHAEFDIHVNEAMTAGWTLDLINAIPRDDAFSARAVEQTLLPRLYKSSPHQDDTDNDKKKVRMVAIARFTAELLDTYTVSDETYRTTKAAFHGDDAVLVEITSIVGYYTYVAYTLNVFQIPSQ